MMTVAPVASAGSAADYYSNKDNYYFLGSLQSQWLGEGAKQLGLEGPVNGDDFTRVLEGKLPDGTELGKDVQGKHVHRPGHDLTFSAPKSVSLLILVGGDKALLAAHDKAVGVAANYIEGLVSARLTQDGVTSIVPTGKMVAAAYTHDTSRNLDPQVHTHLIVANVTELEGQWKALATDYVHKAGFIETVMAHQVTLGKIYRDALKEEIEKLGHETEVVGKHGLWEIKGVPENVREEFSSRGKEIETAVGVDATLKSRDVAAKDTRQAKVDPSKMRLLERWNTQMNDMGFDMKAYQAGLTPVVPAGVTDKALPDAMQAVRSAVSLLSDNKTRFTQGDLLLTALGASEQQLDIKDLRAAVGEAIKESLIVPLDKEKGVFTSQIHLLDELSIQSLAKDVLTAGKVVAFKTPDQPVPPALEKSEYAPLAILNAPAGVTRLRETVEQLVTVSQDKGRSVSVLASSLERGTSLAKSEALKDILIPRHTLREKGFGLLPHSTLIVEGAERLGLKETLILVGEAREKDAQVIFLDSAGRQGNGNALAVLSDAGVARHSLTRPAENLSVSVASISDKRDRYQAVGERYAELSGGAEPVTAVVVGKREQQALTDVIRDALQNAGKLETAGVQVESRSPVYLDDKTRKQPESYRAGLVLEDRSDYKNPRSFVIDRVHPETRMLSLIDADGVLHQKKIRDMDADWRLFDSAQMTVAPGEQLLALAGDKSAGIKAKMRLTVTAVSDKSLTVSVGDKGKTVKLDAGRPLYATYGYVASPGGRDNDTGTVLASLNARDLNTQNVSALAASGDRAEIYTGETLQKAEEKLGRMQQNASPLTLVRRASGEEAVEPALIGLRTGLLTDAQKAVNFAVASQRTVSFSLLSIVTMAQELHNNAGEISAEIGRQQKSGELIPLDAGARGDVTQYVARATFELEKSIIRVIETGKKTQVPLLPNADPALLAGLTAGQRQATELILGTTDQFVGVQGYAGVGKTTQLRSLKAAVETLPDGQRPQVIGLAPTHQAVKEMRGVGIGAQTLKSFLVEHQQKIAAGENPDYSSILFVIDEMSMVGNQDAAAGYQAIQNGNGRGISVGDIDQLKSVESGAPFRLVQERSPMDVAIMKEIVRQNSSDIKAAVYDIIENKAAAALERIAEVSPSVVPREPGSAAPASSIEEIKAPPEDENGKPTVTLSAEQQRRVEIGVTGAIVEDYVGRTAGARQNTIIITQLNDDRKTINAGIHAALQARGVISQQELTIPVLERVSHARHDFNQIDKWSSGQVILQGDRYLDVVNVDTHGRLVTLRDASGRLSMMSPFELDTGQIEVFEKQNRAVAVGDELRFNKTVRPDGHLANEAYQVAAVNDNGTLVLRGAQGQKTVNPAKNQSDQHLDYAWAVTGYGAQGASRDFVIALEGTDGARGRMANKREFYINVSRAREHVQIYTDGVKDWLNQVSRPDNALATAHDALKPETERQQAKAIWAMGSPVAKTGIGRMWQRQNDLKDPSLTARIIPQTRKFPQPHLALPVYDNFGKSAGVVMYPLTPDAQGTLTPGAPRLVTTDRAQGAVVRRSRNGETLLATSAADALELARQHPQSGIVLQTGEQAPSVQLIKLTKGELVAHQDPIVRAAKQVAQHIDMGNWDYSEEMSRMEAAAQDAADEERYHFPDEKAAEKEAVRQRAAEIVLSSQKTDIALENAVARGRQLEEGLRSVSLPALVGNDNETPIYHPDAVASRIDDARQREHSGVEQTRALQVRELTERAANEGKQHGHEQRMAKAAANSIEHDSARTTDKINADRQREITQERGEYAKPSGRTRHIQKER